MDCFNLVSILEMLEVGLGTEIELPYGLSVRIGGENDVVDCCRTMEEKDAIEGMIKAFQGIIVTLNEIHFINLCSLILIMDEQFGIIVCYRDSRLTEAVANTRFGFSLQDIVPYIFENMGVLGVLNQYGVNTEIHYVEFEQLINIWYKACNCGLAQQRMNEHGGKISNLMGLLDVNLME